MGGIMGAQETQIRTILNRSSAEGRRTGKSEIPTLNAVLMALVVALAGGFGLPLLNGLQERATRATLLENLRTLRTQIDRYKLDHGGRAPVVFEGSFPQLVRSTNRVGAPGPAGKNFPCGPYLTAGMPVNPISGSSLVTAIGEFPPTTSRGTGGWLYHQETGQIAPDTPDFLDE